MQKNIFLLFCLLFLACQKVDKNKTPELLIPEDQMVTLLTEASQLNIIRINKLENLKESGIKPSDYLCRKYDVDSLTFAENMSYYTYDPDRLRKIYERVKDSLNTSLKIIDSIIKVKKIEKEQCEKEEKERLKSLKQQDSITPNKKKIKQKSPL